MEILTTMSPNESRSWNQFCNVTQLSSKKTNARENCFFSFCKMIFMTFQKSILDLKSLNICRHIDLLPEFKVCILMEVEFLKSVHCLQHIISWQSWKLKLLSTTSLLSSAPSHPWQTEKNGEIICKENRPN